MSDAMDPRHADPERHAALADGQKFMPAGGSVSVGSHDPINPAHYRGDRVMRIIEEFELDFSLGNTVKYILRHAAKAGLEDLRKARWYLDRKIAQLDGSLK